VTRPGLACGIRLVEARLPAAGELGYVGGQEGMIIDVAIEVEEI
jgi:hypothetical protein